MKRYPFLCVVLCAAGCATYHPPVKPAPSVPVTFIPVPAQTNMTPIEPPSVPVVPKTTLSEKVLTPDNAEFKSLLHTVQHKVVACLNKKYGSNYAYEGSGYVKVPNKHTCWNHLSSWVSNREDDYSGAQQTFLEKTADWMHVCYKLGNQVCFQKSYTQKLKKYKEAALSH